MVGFELLTSWIDLNINYLEVFDIFYIENVGNLVLYLRNILPKSVAKHSIENNNS